MKSFYVTSFGQQSLLLVFLFLTLVLSLFLTIIVYGNSHDKRKRYLHISVFLILSVIQVILTDTFAQQIHGNVPGIWIPVPVLLLWSIGLAVDLFFMWEMIGLYRIKGQRLNRNSIKEAMDQLPGGICYFMRDGSVKLCNLQMYRLFRSLAGKDLQKLSELQEALGSCGSDTEVICLSGELQSYLFPDGKVWRYRESLVKNAEGACYTEVVFSDLTEQYERELELKKQTTELKEISRKLKHLSDHALILTREKEVLAAKTKLHAQMGVGLTAVRRILMFPGTEEAGSAVKLLRQAVSAVKNDNEYPPEKDELAKFIQDAGTIGVKVSLTGKLPEDEEHAFVFLTDMRECLTNSVRHAEAKKLWIEMKEDRCVSIRITNDGTPPVNEVAAKGGLNNLYHYILGYGGTMEIQSKPFFALTIILPKSKEGIL